MRGIAFCLIGLMTAARLSPEAPLGEIRGTVLDELTAVPLHAATIELRGEGTRRVVQTAGERFRIPDLPAGVYDLKISASFYGPTTIRSVPVNAGDIRVLPPLKLLFEGIHAGCARRWPAFFRPLDGSDAAKGSLAGIIVDDHGRPLGDARVRLYLDNLGIVGSSMTDSAGRFVISDVPARRGYKIEVAHDGYYAEDFPDFTVQAGYEAVYNRINLESCENGRCTPALRSIRPLAGCG